MYYDNPFLHLILWACVAIGFVGAAAADTWWSYGFLVITALVMAWFTWDVFIKEARHHHD